MTRGGHLNVGWASPTIRSRDSRLVGNAHPTRGFTLVEMLIAMAITLVMIGAVVTLFANVSNSVRNRRAVVEMSGQLRHARNMLQQDLQGATCPGLTWQRPDENQGYIEIIEGPRREGQASVLVDADPSASPPRNWPPTPLNPEIDHTTSIIPSSNMPLADPTWATDGAGLGDYDDILMLTVRNEHEPFVGRIPVMKGTLTGNSLHRARQFVDWEHSTIESPLAEVVWYAVENPDEDNNAEGFFGEPGMRTIYRRTLLIAPWINPYRLTDSTGNNYDKFQINGDSGTFTAQPGLVRILHEDVDRDEVHQALACLIAFQERYDLSVRLEWDPLLDAANGGRWKIVANTLGDLTKRENRYEHYEYYFDSASGAPSRIYPYSAVSQGRGYTGNSVILIRDPEVVPSPPPPFTPAQVNANRIAGAVVSYTVTDPGTGYLVRPFAYVEETSDRPATARAMLNEEGEVVRVIHGLVPLSRFEGQGGAVQIRRGEDVMLTDALGFDLRVYDPGAPLFGHVATETVLEPTDPAWMMAYVSEDNMKADGSGAIGNNNGATSVVYPFVGQGAYVDLGYGFDVRRLSASPPQSPQLPPPVFAPAFSSSITPWFFQPRALSDVYGNQLAPGYAVCDTWSFHYEHNGLDEDGDGLVDEGTNGFDDPGHYVNPSPPPLTVSDVRFGPDDVGERETVPPYDKPLRGVQVVLRLYERDSRQIRQVSVNQHFVPE